MKERLKQLYKSVILAHSKAPYNYKKVEGQEQIEAYNPLCGDRFVLYLTIKDGIISELHFHGHGCAISKASTSVLVKHLEHKTLEEALILCTNFEQVTQISTDTPAEILEEEFEAFEAAKDFPGRLKCATLSWEAIRKEIINSKNQNSNSKK